MKGCAMRSVWLGLVVVLALGTLATAAERMAVPFVVHDGYFVSNQFEPNAATSFVVLQDQKAFDDIFHAVPPLGGNQKKPNPLPANAFETKMVVAAIHRGKGEWTYKVAGVQLDGKTLIVRYGVTMKPVTFEEACPMIVSVPKGDYTAVRFVENGKDAKTVQCAQAAAQ
jgi:hypothetical protein